MRRTKWPIGSGKDALKIKGIGQGMADRVCPSIHVNGANDRLMNGSMEVSGDSITRTTSRFRPFSCSRMCTVSVRPDRFTQDRALISRPDSGK